MMKKVLLFLIVLSSVFLFSCTTFDHADPYPGMEIIRNGSNSGYEFRNPTSDKLIIYIEGSTWNSVLGQKNGTRWKKGGFVVQLLQVLRDEYNFFILEKLNREPGRSYIEDRNDREAYTFDNLFESYVRQIDSYLSEREYKTVVFIGVSEGAIMLPIVYQQLAEKDKISSLVSMSGGGLSLHESYEILAVSDVTPTRWKKMYKEVINAYQTKPYPDSIDVGYSGFSLKYWSSFIDKRPFDYYKTIDIPVLFIQGEKDYQIPKESTQYINDNLPEKPFQYKFYPDMKHGPSNRSQRINFRNDLANLIKNIN